MAANRLEVKGIYISLFHRMIALALLVAIVSVHSESPNILRRGSGHKKDKTINSVTITDKKNLMTSFKKMRNKEIIRKLDPTYATINGYDCYRTIQGLHDTMADLALQNKVFAEVVKIGNSWMQQQGVMNMKRLYDADITVLIATNRYSAKKKAPMFVMCNMIPAELAPPEACAQFAEKLIKERKTNGDFQWMLDYMEVHFIFQANPDGRAAQEKDLNKKVYKNLSSGPNDSCSGTTDNHIGTNINSNFPHSSWSDGMRVLCNKKYRGSAANSEPETKAVVDHITSVMSDYPVEQLGIVLDIHSTDQEILWPLLSSSNPTNNIDTSYPYLAEKLAMKTTPPFRFNNGRNIVRDGTLVDWANDQPDLDSLYFGLGTEDFEECTNFDQVNKNMEALITYVMRTENTLYGNTGLSPEVELISPLEIYPPSFRMKVKVTPDVNATITQVDLYLNQHPFEKDSKPSFSSMILTPIGNSAVKTTILSLPSSLSKGTHIVYVQAKGTLSVGPVYAHKFKVEDSATYNPTSSPTISNAPTSAPILLSTSNPILNTPAFSPFFSQNTNLPSISRPNDTDVSNPDGTPLAPIFPPIDTGCNNTSLIPFLPFLPFRKRLGP